jgi:hypothetical protein
MNAITPPNPFWIMPINVIRVVRLVHTESYTYLSSHLKI